MEWLSDPHAWAALLTLTALEIVLGIDNIIFVSILTGKLPQERQQKARLIGLSLAMIMRILLLFSITWIMRLTAPVFIVAAQEISARDLILLFGGLFLIGKSTHEIHDKLEGVDEETGSVKRASFTNVIIQIMLLDIVFSLDSVITAIGMANQLVIMIIAVVIAIGFMMAFAKTIGDFVEKHPTLKMLALSFLLLIGIMLVAEAFDQHIPKGYIYFAMAFSVFVEMLNIKLRAKAEPVRLRKKIPTLQRKKKPRSVEVTNT